MTRQNALRQYIAAKKTLQPQSTMQDMIKDLKKMKTYKYKSYANLYATVQRVFMDMNEKSDRKPRRKTSRTPQNVKLVKKILDKTNTTRKGSVRGIKAALKQEYGITLSREFVRRTLLYDLKLKFVRYKRRQKLTKQHKENRVICA